MSLRISAQGPQGIPGPQGQAGLDGAPGTQGPVGAQGPAGSSTAVIPFSYPGEITVRTGTARLYMPTGGSNLTVIAGIATLPTNQPIIVDVNKNGTTVFTTQANRPTVGTATNSSGVKTPNVTTFAAGDYFTVDVDQIGVQTLTPNPTYVATNVQAGVNTAATYSVTRPTGIQAGDLHIVYLGSRGASVWTAPTGVGWNTLGTPTTGTSMSIPQTIYGFWRIDDGVSQSFTFTADVASARVYGVGAAFRSVHQTTPIDVTAAASAAAGTTFSYPAVTTTVANTMLHGFATFDANSTTAAAPTGYTGRLGFDNTSTSIKVADKIQAAAGASGTPTFTNVGSSAGVLAQTAIRPPDPPSSWSPGQDLTVILRYAEA